MDVQGLISAIEAHRWSMVIALALLAVVALAGDVVVRAGVTGRALQVVSLLRGYVGGVASVFMQDRWLTVTKTADTPWSEMLPRLAPPIRSAPAAGG